MTIAMFMGKAKDRLCSCCHGSVLVCFGLVLHINLNTGQTHLVNPVLQRSLLYREQRERFRSLPQSRVRQESWQKIGGESPPRDKD